MSLVSGIGTSMIAELGDPWRVFSVRIIDACVRPNLSGFHVTNEIALPSGDECKLPPNKSKVSRVRHDDKSSIPTG